MRTEYLSEAQWAVKEIFDLLLDQGHSPETALTVMQGESVPPGLRSATPTLDSIMTPEFVESLMI